MFNIYEEIEKGEYLFPNNIEEVDKMSGKEFESFLFYFFKKQGIKVRKTNSSNDKGIDLILTVKINDENTIIGIQAKRWSQNVNSQEIRNMLDGKDEYNCNKLWIITTSNLTQEATETALNNDIVIKSRDTIIEMIDTLHKDKDVKFKKLEQEPTNKNTNNVLNNIEQTKYNQLKDLRAKISKELKIPLWSVYSNETILLLIKDKPTSIDQLLKYKNIGHKKVDNYGTEIINILNS